MKIFFQTILFFFFFLHVFLYFWLHWISVAAKTFSSCTEWGSVLVAVFGLLIVVASLVEEHKL